MRTITETKEFEGAFFDRVSLEGARIARSNLNHVTMRAVDTDGLDIDNHDLMFGSLIVNGIDVVPLVEAALDERFPGRALMRAQSIEGLREGWEAVQTAWADTVTTTPATQANTQVNDEWSLEQTLRHLILATDAWLRGGVQRESQPFHEIGLIFAGAERMGFDMSIFRDETPSFDEVLQVRAERQQLVSEFLASATDAVLAEPRKDPWGGDWSPTVGDCIRVILEEEWAHLRYIRRDLATLNTES